MKGNKRMASEMSTKHDEETKPLKFNPLKAVKKGKKRIVRWVSCDGAPSNQEDVSTPKEVMADVEQVLKGKKDGNLQALSLRDPDTFKAGELRSHVGLWTRILDGYKDKRKVMKWIRSGVNIEEFSQHFKGKYNGVRYNSRLPPRRKLRNHKSCNCNSENERFVTNTLLRHLESGTVRVWGRVEEGKPPWLVLPMTVEPTKPRLCIDARYLNLWMKDNPKSSLELLKVVPNFVYKNSFMSKIDDKSAYEHVLLTKNSEKYFGIEWQGWWLVFRTLPFGWKNAQQVYQTVGLGASHFFRSRGIACSLYTDDRLNGELFSEEGRWSRPISQRNPEFSSQAAKAALYVVCKVLVNLGYFLGWQKCIFEPSTSIVYLGMLIDSTTQSFSVPQEKKDKFAKLREEILKSECSDPLQFLKSLKKLKGKCQSFSKAFPLENFYVREMIAATKDRPQASLSPRLRDELKFWRFLDDWKDVIPWRRDKTVRVSLSISPLQWTATIHLPSGDQKYDEQFHNSEQPINVLGIQAVKSALEKLPSDLRDCEVKIAVNSKEVRDEWKAGELTQVKKKVLEIAVKRNILVNFSMDDTSTGFPKSDAMLSQKCWNIVQAEFGGLKGHNLDLMSLDANCQKDKNGHPLRHFTPYTTPNSAGVDVFSQDLSECDGAIVNAYVFPPFYLIPKLLQYFMSQGAVVTMVVPKFSPVPTWLPIIKSLSHKKFKRLAKRGDRNALRYPNEDGGFQSRSSMELWAFRVDGKRGKPT